MINIKNLALNKIKINVEKCSYLPHWMRDGQKP